MKYYLEELQTYHHFYLLIFFKQKVCEGSQVCKYLSSMILGDSTAKGDPDMFLIPFLLMERNN